MASRHNILVLDSHDPHVRAAEQLGKELGHAVVNHASPVGVSQALARFDVDVVILGWDLAVQQDSKLGGLIDSWNRVRQLKVIVIVDEPRQDLERHLAARHDVTVIDHETLETRLAAVLGRPSQLFPVVDDPRVGEEGQFVQRLRSRLQSASIAWEGIAQGLLNPREIQFPLTAARGQAELMKLGNLTVLLDELSEVLKRDEVTVGRPTPDQYDAVTAALRFAIHAAAAPPYDSGRDISPLVRRLRRARS